MKLPPKRRKGEGPRPPGGGEFRTQRGVTGSESRAPSPAPQGSNQVPGCRAPGGRQLLRRVEGGKQGGWSSLPGPLPQPCGLPGRRGNRRTPLWVPLFSLLFSRGQLASGGREGHTEASRGRYWFLEVDVGHGRCQACDRSAVTGKDTVSWG